MTRSADGRLTATASKQARKAAEGVKEVSRIRHASASREKQGSSDASELPPLVLVEPLMYGMAMYVFVEVRSEGQVSMIPLHSMSCHARRREGVCYGLAVRAPSKLGRGMRYRVFGLGCEAAAYGASRAHGGSRGAAELITSGNAGTAAATGASNAYVVDIKPALPICAE